jgi:hypothetical protein
MKRTLFASTSFALLVLAGACAAAAGVQQGPWQLCLPDKLACRQPLRMN